MSMSPMQGVYEPPFEMEIRQTLPQKEFDALNDYSMSNPTGVIPGKVWKRNTRVFMGPPANWVICSYIEAADPKFCHIEIRVPVIVG